MKRIVVRVVFKSVIVIVVVFLGILLNHSITGSSYWNPIISGIMVFFIIGVIFYRPKKKTDDYKLDKTDNV